MAPTDYDELFAFTGYKFSHVATPSKMNDSLNTSKNHTLKLHVQKWTTLIHDISELNQGTHFFKIFLLLSSFTHHFSPTHVNHLVVGRMHPLISERIGSKHMSVI
jgi:hypothetical protein